MSVLRRASNPLKAFSSGSFRGGCTGLEIASCYLEDHAGLVDPKLVTFDRFVSLKRYHHSRFDFSKPFIGRQHFSSPAGMKSSGEEDDDLEDGFSELETPAIADAAQARNVAQEDDELISGFEISEEENGDDVAGLEKELELSDTEADLREKRFSPTKVSSQLFKAIMNASGLSTKKVLDKWVEEGNDLNRDDISRLMLHFRKHWMYGKALHIIT